MASKASGVRPEGGPGQPLSPSPPAGTALQCYFCMTETSNKDCQHVQNCSDSQTHCWTQRISVAGLLFLSKGCSANCEDNSQNYYMVVSNTTCCSSDLCNASGARALQPALGPLLLLAAACSLMLWGPSQL
ncbi:prostate stem cell antigen [Pteropus alecto]|uniref:prostate stem cell antigen n=1 Tax=Pteropus alecto TaxID=9402 RepID=UPI000D534DD5|nr:prostate stem cell antigen [Pteropus alecto]